jgi:hypothetical protein
MRTIKITARIRNKLFKTNKGIGYLMKRIMCLLGIHRWVYGSLTGRKECYICFKTRNL